jgi:hypothetical protein
MAEDLTDIQQTPHLSEQTHADIFEAAESAYAVLAAKYEHPIEAIHRVPLCEPTSELIGKDLHERGYRVRPIRGPAWIVHHYLALPSEETEERVFVDPTWQQFLPRRDMKAPGMPKVLIGTPDEVITAARFYGVRANRLDAYRPHAMKFPQTTVEHCLPTYSAGSIEQ